ncbi:MAG TPA: heavy-metal-associated domain-containing protein [Chitinophagales bacterium]|nr:heavy-metal-associated domain-containing protein [Chitinophagales bacterium]HNM32269.1 heavy-metal-associated domain-containing protein [Chitinophagales bacterium]
MENKTFKFKTNINCGGCIATVKPHLDAAKGITSWNVDTTHKDKILTVQTENISAKEVMAVVQNAGYKIEEVPA